LPELDVLNTFERILAIETSQSAGSVAVSADGAAIELPLPTNARSAVTLGPAIQLIFRQAGMRPAEVQAVAVAHGPGSFTGLRIGVTTAKALAYAWQVPLVSVLTTDVLAAQAMQTLPAIGAAQEAVVSVALDAHREQVFTAEYQIKPFAADSEAPFNTIRETQILDYGAWLKSLLPGMFVTGPILERISENVPPGVHLLPRDCWQPAARTVLRLAAASLRRGAQVDPFQLVPLYLRPSYAEEKRPAAE
jgi:tRNA threonylcarbamoyladenosine biosynthesis protein TsaB